jgi:hypothetical protein
MVLWLVEHRALVSAIAGVASSGAVWSRMPWPAADPILVMIEFQRPALYMGLHVTYAVMLFTTPYITISVLLSLVYIFLARRSTPSVRSQPLAYIEPELRKDLTLVIGECHHTNRPTPCSNPHWLTLPERGLFTGIAIIGAIGSGKTSGCMYPFAKQILGFRRTDPARRIGGLVLEVKGDFCHQVRAVLNAHGRAGDYVEVGLEGPWRYNPLHNDLDAYALAYGIASLLNNVFGKGKEPFWQQAYTNLVKFIILLHKVLNGYVTLFEVYECAINPDLLAERIAEADRQLARVETVLVDPETYLAHRVLATYPFELDTATGRMRAQATVDLKGCLDANRIPYDERNDVRNADAHDMRRAQFEAVKRWFDNDWRRIEPKLRTSIVEGISVFLSLFDDNPTMKCAFCPPKECYDPIANADGHYGVPLPPFADLIESGKVCALNFPVAANPGLAKTIGTLMKQDFQRAVLSRIPSMAATPNRHRRAVLFMCDEYHAFATVGEADPTGDEKFFSLSRQAKCIPIVATQSVSSLRSALPGESWRTLLQTFRTKVFLAMSDDYSTRVASDLCGKEEQLKLHYNISESGQDARVSVLTGRTAAHKATITTSKSYAVQRDYVFEPKVFAELKNAQAVVLAYDGQNPLPPTYCYLKPYYLNPNVSYFDQVARGEL